jgi:hypothetical protein
VAVFRRYGRVFMNFRARSYRAGGRGEYGEYGGARIGESAASRNRKRSRKRAQFRRKSSDIANDERVNLRFQPSFTLSLVMT